MNLIVIINNKAVQNKLQAVLLVKADEKMYDCHIDFYVGTRSCMGPGFFLYSLSFSLLFIMMSSKL